MTIHKVQGQILEKVLIYIEKPIFQDGQLYVALTRAKRKEHVKVFVNQSTCTKNIVNKSVLQ